jgi:hypothetical protein
MIDIGLTTNLDQLQAVWKGSDTDEELWYASFDGSGWSSPAVIPGAASSVGPGQAWSPNGHATMHQHSSGHLKLTSHGVG